MTRRKSRVNPLTVVIPIGFVLVIAVLIFIGITRFTDSIHDLTAQRDELEHYINSNRANDSEKEAEALRVEAEAMSAHASELTDILYNLSSYPDLYGEQYRKLFDYAGDEIELSNISYDRRTGILSFSATCQSVRKIPHFVRNLRASGYFSDVQYEGYVLGYNPSGSVVSNPITGSSVNPSFQIDEYRYSIKCLLENPDPALPTIVKPVVEETADSNIGEKDGE